MAAQEQISIAIDAINNASKVLNQIERDLADLDKQEQRNNKTSKDTEKSLDSLAASYGKVGAALSIGVTAPLVKLGKTMLDQVGNIEQYKIAFDVMLGSAEAGSALLKEVSDFAAKTPFDLPGVVESSKQLLALGIETDKLLPTLKALGDVSAGTGGDLQRLTLNFGQVATQGKLTGRELRDFAVNGVPLIATLADQFGVAEDQIQDMVSAGQVGFADVEQAFITMTSEGGRFFDLMDKQSKTLKGILSNMRDNFIRVSLAVLGFSSEAENFGEIVEGGPFDILKTQAENLLGSMDDLVEKINAIPTSTKTTIVAILGVVAALGPLALLIAGVSAALSVLLSTAGLVTIGVGALVATFIAMRDKIDTERLGEALTNIFSGIKNVVSLLAPILKELVVFLGEGFIRILVDTVEILGWLVQGVGALAKAVEGLVAPFRDVTKAQEEQIEMTKNQIEENEKLAGILGEDYADYIDYVIGLDKKRLAFQEASAELIEAINKRKTKRLEGLNNEEYKDFLQKAKDKVKAAEEEQDTYIKENEKRIKEFQKQEESRVVKVRSVIEATQKLGKEEADYRIKLIKDLAITDENIQKALLDVKGDITEEGVRAAIAAYNEELTAAGDFRDKLVNTFKSPIVQTIQIALGDSATGKGLATFIQGATGIDVGAFLGESAAQKAVEDQITQKINKLDRDIGGGGGGSAKGTLDKAGEDIVKAAEDFQEDYNSFVREINRRTEGQFLESGDIDTVSEALETINEEYEQVKDNIREIIDEHEEWVEEAQKGLDEYEKKIDEINKKYEDLQNTLATDTAQTIGSELADALRDQEEIEAEIAEARKEYSGADADQAAAISEKIRLLREELDLRKEFVDNVNDLVGRENVEGLSKSLEARQEELIALGKQVVLQDKSNSLAKEYANFQAEQNLSQLEFILYKAGIEAEELEKKKKAEIDTLREIQEIQQQIVDGEAKTIDLEALRDRGFSEEALDFAEKARNEAIQYEAHLNAQLELLEEFASDEENIYDATFAHIVDGQKATEESLKASYTRLIGKLKEVEAQARRTASALAAAGGGGAGAFSGGQFATGGFTQRGNIREVAGVVHKGEWVAPNWMVRNYRPMFDNLERMRRTRGQGFMEGGNVGGGTVYQQPITMQNTINSEIDFDVISKQLAWHLRTQ